MDILTHAASGLLIASALPRPPRTRWTPFLFALAACAPDLDLLFASGSPKLFLALHRGFSHALLFLPVYAAALAALAYPLWRGKTPGALPFRNVWLLFWACMLAHAGLDCLNSFGTKLLIPFSAERVRLNCVFIFEPLLSFPLVGLAAAGYLFRRRKRTLARIGLVWLVLFPAICLAAHSMAGKAFEDRCREEGRTVRECVLLPDFLSPLYWRALTIEDGADGLPAEVERSVSGLGRPRETGRTCTPLSEGTAMRMAAQSAAARDFLSLMLMPVTSPLPKDSKQRAINALQLLSLRDDADPAIRAAVADLEGLRYLVVYDLRFGSGLEAGRRILDMRPRANSPFRMLTVLDAEDNVLLERLSFSDMHQETTWRQPVPPKPATFASWFFGLE